MTASGTSTDAGASMDAGASVAVDDHHEQNAIAELESLVWGVEGERYPISWEMQGLNASWLPEQLANGPCGVLAAYSAQLLRLRHESKSEEVAEADLRTAPLTPEMQAAGLAELLVRVLVQPLPCSVAGANGNGNAPTTSPRRQHLQKMKSVVYLCTQLHPLPRFLQVEVDLVLDRAGLSVLRSAVRSAVEPHLAAFNGPAGVILLVYSLVRTRGVKNVLLDAGANNLNLSIEGLIAAPFNLCTAELLSLFMRGTASPDFEHDCVQEPGSDALGAEASTSTTSPVCGLLTSLEIESGAPMAAAFKNPPAPIFILHGGDHYTLLWQENAGSAPDGADSKSITSSGACSKMKKTFHFNGLPPAGPRLCTIDLRAPASLSTSSGRAASSPSGSSNPNRNKYVKPEPGEIEDIVQSKKPAPSASSAPAPSSEDYTQWTYEVALALENPDVSASEQRDLAQDPIHKFELGEPPKSGPWRCRKCYETRFSTMCFGQNEIEPFVVKESVDAEVDAANLVYNKDLTSTSCPAADVDAAGGAATTSTTTCSSAAGGSMKGASEQEEARCRHCGDLISVCGWTLWLGFAELPGRWRRRVRLRYGPKIMRVLETKWPDADLQAVDGKTRAEGWALPSV